MLLADDGAHRGAEEHRVHLEACVLERALDDVQGDRVDVDVGDLGDPQLLGLGCHVGPPSYALGVIRML